MFKIIFTEFRNLLVGSFFFKLINHLDLNQQPNEILTVDSTNVMQSL